MTSRTSDGVSPAPDLELKALAELYARHAPDLTRGHHTAVLFDAAASHRALARQRMPGEPVVRTSPDGAVPDQPDSPRGPVEIDPVERDVVQNIYIRRVEKRDGKLVNIDIDTVPMVKDPWKIDNPAKTN